MIYDEIETTTEEVMEFLRAAGIEFENDPEAKCFQLKLADGSIVEMPPDFNIFDEMSPFTFVESCSYSSSCTNSDDSCNNSNDSKTYVYGNLVNGFNNSANSFKNVSAA